MDHYYDNHAVSVFVENLIADSPRGTQAKLAQRLGLPPATVSRWAKRQNCPGHTVWPAIEEFFGLEPGTIRGVGGVGPSTVGETEAVILGDDRFTEDQRRTLLLIADRFLKDNAVLAAARADRRQPTAPSSPS